MAVNREVKDIEREMTSLYLNGRLNEVRITYDVLDQSLSLRNRLKIVE